MIGDKKTKLIKSLEKKLKISRTGINEIRCKADNIVLNIHKSSHEKIKDVVGFSTDCIQLITIDFKKITNEIDDMLHDLNAIKHTLKQKDGKINQNVKKDAGFFSNKKSTQT